MSPERNGNLSTPLHLPKPLDTDIDKENAFLLYATFCGDIVRTAHALNVQPDVVARAAQDGGWNDKLGPILTLKKSTRPGDVERAINRALNFVQAHQMRLFVSRTIHKLTGLSDTEFMGYIFIEDREKEGAKKVAKLSTRAIADLASAMEKCQAMTYQALADTATDRAKRHESEADPEVSAGDMHARIAAAMAQVAADNSPAAKLLEAQLGEANRLRNAFKQA